MKLIKFVMAKGENIILPYEQAQKILNSHQQIIQVLDDNGEWTGTTINKAHIICTKEDFEAEKDKQVISKEFRLPQAGDSTVDEKDKPVRVLGGWQRPSVRKNMIRLFNRMKKQGHFKGFKTYQDWEAAKYDQ